MNIFYTEPSGWLGWTETNGVYSIHMELTHWSIGNYKKYINIFSSFLNQFEKGTILFAVAKTEKAKKFNELFGLQQLGTQDSYYVMGIEV